jgi:hypothetical protein
VPQSFFQLALDARIEERRAGIALALTSEKWRARYARQLRQCRKGNPLPEFACEPVGDRRAERETWSPQVLTLCVEVREINHHCCTLRCCSRAPVATGHHDDAFVVRDAAALQALAAHEPVALASNA